MAGGFTSLSINNFLVLHLGEFLFFNKLARYLSSFCVLILKMNDVQVQVLDLGDSRLASPLKPNVSSPSSIASFTVNCIFFLCRYK